MRNLIFDVAFSSKDIKPNQSQVCVLVDVIRATTAMIVMLEKGCSEIILTKDEKPQMEKHSYLSSPDTLICAEEPEGTISKYADFSPSLSSIYEQNIKGKRILLKTTNGTLAGLNLWKAGFRNILIGCMHNAKAVMDKAVSMALELDSNITIVCAGRENSTIAALDDAYTAGVLLKYGAKAAEANHCTPILKDSAKMSSHLLSIYQNTKVAFENSGSGETMRRINCLEDISICAMENLSSIAPVLSMTEDEKIQVKNVKEEVLK
ncbi:putative 2-phosphosulfolactate phosphatase [Compostibacillus humi]|uniref:Probable 2-phosphosulfolactate phosphatase n=1 Tax=Compostibacillus humi TaxID=1245525 RepID=A0A8J2TQQ8_9BACI|nr:2-phosphosulfolactate phosphatase [Compostibacillus humi]GFZ82098.1 putative 2-phosphosulfolactate phosphatase [Compostibacillus humi]